jgi:hypothetical protein
LDALLAYHPIYKDNTHFIFMVNSTARNMESK